MIGKLFGMEWILKMNKLLSKLKKLELKQLVLGFFIINLILKIVFIKSTPPSATYDEIIYIGEAQSIVKYGTDLAGGWRPWHLEPSDSYYTELTSTVLVPGFILFPNDPILAAKLVPILLGSLLPIMLGLTAYRLKRRKLVFVFTALFATLNPWVFQFSRLGYDSLFSVGFYSIGLVGLLYLKDWKKLWTLIPFFFGFYQYQGHKVLLVPLIGLVFFYQFFDNYELLDVLKKFKKVIKDKSLLSTFVPLLFALLLTVTYLIRLPHLTSGERISEFSFYDELQLIDEVNEQRRVALPSKLTPVFINKYTVLAKDFTERFLNSFNIQHLFIKGDKGVDTFTVYDYGFFHLIDVVVIVLALAFLVRKGKDKRVLYFLLGYIFIGALPNAIRTGQPWITFRGAFAFLGIVMVMGLGFANFYDEIKNKFKWGLVPLYILLVSQFFFIYFVRYPITHTTYLGIYERVVASYLTRIGENPQAVIVPDRADATFNYLISYNKLLTKENQGQVNESASIKVFEINNIIVASNCLQEIHDLSNDIPVFVYLFKKPCEPDNSEVSSEIKSLIDGGTIFTVHNDILCSEYNLGSYPRVNSRNYLNVESLSDQDFCETFFSK